MKKNSLTQYGKERPGMAGFSNNTKPKLRIIIKKRASLIPRWLYLQYILK